MDGKWIRKPTGQLSVVFVHGILSGAECWRHSIGTYWPELLESEERLAAAGIYIFNYKTGFFSGSYSLGDVVDALREALRLDGVEKSQDLVFVCHSQGGIVARRFVVQNALALVSNGKRIGLFLIGSPSLGSKYANWIAPIAWLLQHSQAIALRFAQNNRWLNDLDSDFRNLKESGRLDLRGKELVEDTFVVLPKLSLWKQVVEPFSGARYFGDAIKIPNSDHSSIPTVADSTSLQHRLLVEFLLHYLLPSEEYVDSRDAAAGRMGLSTEFRAGLGGRQRMTVGDAPQDLVEVAGPKNLTAHVEALLRLIVENSNSDDSAIVKAIPVGNVPAQRNENRPKVARTQTASSLLAIVDPADRSVTPGSNVANEASAPISEAVAPARLALRLLLSEIGTATSQHDWSRAVRIAEETERLLDAERDVLSASLVVEGLCRVATTYTSWSDTCAGDERSRWRERARNIVSRARELQG